MFEAGAFEAFDAAGEPIPNVETARLTDAGIEIMLYIGTENGDPFVCSIDDGVTFEPVRARVEIPGGALFNMQEG